MNEGGETNIQVSKHIQMMDAGAQLNERASHLLRHILHGVSADWVAMKGDASITVPPHEGLQNWDQVIDVFKKVGEVVGCTEHSSHTPK